MGMKNMPAVYASPPRSAPDCILPSKRMDLLLLTAHKFRRRVANIPTMSQSGKGRISHSITAQSVPDVRATRHQSGFIRCHSSARP